MSVKKKSIQYAAVAIAVSLAIIAASTVFLGLPTPSTQPVAVVQGGQQETLAIQLTDPPQVPSLTSSLNITYTSLGLLVGEPTGTPGQLITKSVVVTPSGGHATVDLLTLQNVSQTIALANLPSGSVLYSVTFTVQSISIDVNNTVSSVSLAIGGNTFQVTIAYPAAFSSRDYALLQLNPVVVNTPSGYQLIPSSVGVMRHGGGPFVLGQRHQLTNNENNQLVNAKGQVTASITALSVKDNITTFSVLVNNSANVPVTLNAIGLHGNFTVLGSVCQSFFGKAIPYGSASGEGDEHSTSMHMSGHFNMCTIPLHMDEVVFVPQAPSSASTTSTSSTQPTSSSCATDQMSLVNGAHLDFDTRGLTLNAGQCVVLTFVGKLSFGNANFVLVPATSSGQVYALHVIGSNGANQMVSCTLPLGTSSCQLLQPQQDSWDWLSAPKGAGPHLFVDLPTLLKLLPELTPVY